MRPDDATIRAAGHTLRQLRENTYGYTQRDITKLSRERWGDEGELDQAVLSKIERGAMAKPLNLREAAELAALYNKPLTWIAELYGLPVMESTTPDQEPTVERYAQALRRIPINSPRREELIRWVDFAIQQTLAQIESERGA